MRVAGEEWQWPVNRKERGLAVKAEVSGKPLKRTQIATAGEVPLADSIDGDAQETAWPRVALKS